MALKFVDELPASARKPSSGTSKVFTEDLADQLRENPSKWAYIKDGTAQGAAAWVKRMSEQAAGFEYSSVDTGKPTGKERKTPQGDATYMPTIKDIYVRFNPDLADAPVETQASQNAAEAEADPADEIA